MQEHTVMAMPRASAAGQYLHITLWKRITVIRNTVPEEQLL